MLELIRRTLIEAGLAAAGDALSYNIFRKRHRVLHVFDQQRLLFVIKFAPAGGAETEYAAAVAAHAAFGELAPKPLAFRRVDGTEIAVYRAIAHEPLTRRWPQTQPDLVVAGMNAYLARALDSFRADRPSVSHRERLAASLRVIRPHVPRMVDFPESAVLNAAALERMPFVPQHGDFFLNNLGVTADGLLAFDWEDFGAVSLFGCDLAVFVCSTIGFRLAAIAALREGRTPAPVDRILCRFCDTVGIARPDFFALLPAFLTETLRLKIERDYNRSIFAPLSDLLLSLSELPPAETAALKRTA